jgi:hypothetical protein
MVYEWLMPGREPLPFLPLWQGSRPGITGFPSAEMRAASRFRAALIAAAGGTPRIPPPHGYRAQGICSSNASMTVYRRRFFSPSSHSSSCWPSAFSPDILDGGDAHLPKVSVPFDARAREPLAIPQADAYTASGGGGHRLTVIPELDVFATVTA